MKYHLQWMIGEKIVPVLEKVAKTFAKPKMPKICIKCQFESHKHLHQTTTFISLKYGQQILL
jgi:hypothetical protein